MHDQKSGKAWQTEYMEWLADWIQPGPVRSIIIDYIPWRPSVYLSLRGVDAPGACIRLERSKELNDDIVHVGLINTSTNESIHQAIISLEMEPRLCGTSGYTYISQSCISRAESFDNPVRCRWSHASTPIGGIPGSHRHDSDVDGQSTLVVSYTCGKFKSTMVSWSGERPAIVHSSYTECNFETNHSDSDDLDTARHRVSYNPFLKRWVLIVYTLYYRVHVYEIDAGTLNPTLLFNGQLPYPHTVVSDVPQPDDGSDRRSRSRNHSVVSDVVYVSGNPDHPVGAIIYHCMEGLFYRGIISPSSPSAPSALAKDYVSDLPSYPTSDVCLMSSVHKGWRLSSQHVRHRSHLMFIKYVDREAKVDADRDRVVFATKKWTVLRARLENCATVNEREQLLIRELVLLNNLIETSAPSVEQRNSRVTEAVVVRLYSAFGDSSEPDSGHLPAVDLYSTVNEAPKFSKATHELDESRASEFYHSTETIDSGLWSCFFCTLVNVATDRCIACRAERDAKRDTDNSVFECMNNIAPSPLGTRSSRTKRKRDDMDMETMKSHNVILPPVVPKMDALARIYRGDLPENHEFARTVYVDVSIQTRDESTVGAPDDGDMDNDSEPLQSSVPDELLLTDDSKCTATEPNL